MQEIKFRAWVRRLDRMCNVTGIDFERNEINILRPGWHMSEWLRRDQVELMQYSGLDDVNGKPIYGGDIVVVVSQYWGQLGNRYEVKFRKGAFYAEYVLLSEISPSISVIGNIHENPELLEAEL